MQPTLNKAVVINLLILLTVAGCREPSGQSNKLKAFNAKNMVLKKKIGAFLHLNQPSDAMHLVDSLIKKDTDKNGYLYFEKGMIDAYNRNFSDAILNFAKADSLKYDKKSCQEMTVFCRREIQK